MHILLHLVLRGSISLLQIVSGFFCFFFHPFSSTQLQLDKSLDKSVYYHVP